MPEIIGKLEVITYSWSYPAEGKTHGTINSDLGRSDDKLTQAVWKSLDNVLKK